MLWRCCQYLDAVNVLKLKLDNRYLLLYIPRDLWYMLIVMALLCEVQRLYSWAQIIIIDFFRCFYYTSRWSIGAHTESLDGKGCPNDRVANISSAWTCESRYHGKFLSWDIETLTVKRTLRALLPNLAAKRVLVASLGLGQFWTVIVE